MRGEGIIPAELLRTYVRKEEPDLSNLQISAAFWCLNRGRGMEADMMEWATYLHAEPSVLQIGTGEGDGAPDADGKETGDGEEKDELGKIQDVIALDPAHFDDLADAQSAAQESQAGKSYIERYENYTVVSNRPKPIETLFTGDSKKYMSDFRDDVNAYLTAAPSLDANVVLGMLPAALEPSAAHELLSDAMRLDPSARNNIPSSVCIWMGARSMTCDAAIKQVTLERNPRWDEGPAYDWRDPEKEVETEPKTFLPLGVRNLAHEEDDTPVTNGEEGDLALPASTHPR